MLDRIKEIIPSVDENKSDLIYQKAMLKKYKKKPIFYKPVLIPILSLLLVIAIIIPISLNSDNKSSMSDAMSPSIPDNNISQDMMPDSPSNNEASNCINGSTKSLAEAMNYANVSEVITFSDFKLQDDVSYYLKDNVYSISYYYGVNRTVSITVSNRLEILDIENKTKDEYINKEKYTLNDNNKLDIYYHFKNDEQIKSAICLYTKNNQYYLISYSLLGDNVNLDIYTHIISAQIYKI